MRLPLDDIVCDPLVQVREKVDQVAVEQYVDDWDLLPPIVVYRLPDGRLLLADGFHRVGAARKLELTEIDVVLKEGTYEDACDWSARANMASGKQLTKDERHKAIAAAYERHKPITQRELADLLGCSQFTVGRVLTIEEVKTDVGPLELNNSKEPESVGPGAAKARGRRKKAVNDDHLVALSEAQKEDRKPLAEATAKRSWTARETKAAIAEINDSQTPEERKEELRRGEADPIVRTEKGDVTALPETFMRAMTEPTSGDAYNVFAAAITNLAKLVEIPRSDIIAPLSVEDLRSLAYDDNRLPNYAAVILEVRDEARRSLEPHLQVLT